MIAIVDYGVGNLYSLRSSLEFLGVECIVTGDGATLRDADKIILPGVGAFGDARQALADTALDKVVIDLAKNAKPLLGICLGMQLLYSSSQEYGTHQGLGLLAGEILSISESAGEKPLRVPHIGYNNLEIIKAGQLTKYIKQGDYVYYVHSFYAKVSKETCAYSDYGGVYITGIVEDKNIFGTQFHPEKSGEVGLKILKAFADI